MKDIHYADHVEFETYVEEKDKEAFLKWMTELTNGKSKNTEGELTYLETDVSPKGD